MARKRYENRLQTVNDINVTPLMDLTFLLLIVFMITAPVLEYETDVSPPPLATDTPVEEDKAIMVNVTQQGTVILEKQELLSLADLTARLAAEATPESAVKVRADGDCVYKTVIDVMKAVRAANITNIMLVTQPET